ncbi:MAG TPA: hypothetical protein VKU82_02790 [Planctomycetaceae bacterium]|nr:hypothetical protein [Planctomycetaceae bacterium]
MATVTHNQAETTFRGAEHVGGATYQAYQILHFAFAAAPIIAGIDKFFDALANWDLYLSPMAQNILGEHGHQFMMVVGVVEIIAGLGVAFKPRYFAYIVAIWLAAIIVNLLMCGAYYDIALRDFGLFLGATALGRLAMTYDPPVRTAARSNRI